jgi:CTP synthase
MLDVEGANINIGRKPKYIFVTGGVMSGLGKGVTTASTAKLLHLAGFKTSCVKIDPYLNVDAGTMNPIIHGEVFVTDDGGETDMDLGTYERFLDQNLTFMHNITTGQVYLRVIEGERRGDYLGRCVQIIPHITDEIKKRIREVATQTNVDVLVVECGGTVGDIEGLPFLEALRQMRLEEGQSNAIFVHVTLAPELDVVGEQKTKPTQHSVQELRRIGIQPDILVVRSRKPLTKAAKEKIALFCNVELSSVISNPDTPSVYAVPEILSSEGILETACRRLQMRNRQIQWDDWRETVKGFFNPTDTIRIAMVGKYVTLADSYVSINQALTHAAAYIKIKINVDWVDSEEFERNTATLQMLDKYSGILVPGGFGKRGTEGKILVANYAREHSIPYLGLCLGFQLAAVSFARHACGLRGANSTEFDPETPYPVIDLLPEQKTIMEMGATMRLGGHDIHIVEDTIADKIYKNNMIRERHRHRYEFNQTYRREFEESSMVFSGWSDDKRRIEILEIPNHIFYLATQYHPEFISRPGKPEPVFLAFTEASLCRKQGIKTTSFFSSENV